MKFLSETLEAIHVRALSVEMNRQQDAESVMPGFAHVRLNRNGIEVECLRIDIGERRARSRPHDCAGRSEKAERSGENLISRLYSSRSESQPQGIGSGGATDGVRRAAETRQFALKTFYLRPENVVL
jgi:hypothetical protein